MVLSGRERGKSGKVLRVMPKKGRVLVEKLNLVKRHTKPGMTASKQGGIVEKEGSLSISNVLLLCPKCNAPARISTRVLEDGTRVRFCRKCKEQIDR